MSQYLESGKYYFGITKMPFYQHKVSKQIIYNSDDFNSACWSGEINFNEWEEKSHEIQIPFYVDVLKVWDENIEDFKVIADDKEYRDCYGILTLDSQGDDYDYTLDFDRDIDRDELDVIVNNFKEITNLEDIVDFKKSVKEFNDYMEHQADMYESQYC